MSFFVCCCGFFSCDIVYAACLLMSVVSGVDLALEIEPAAAVTVTVVVVAAAAAIVVVASA